MAKPYLWIATAAAALIVIAGIGIAVSASPWFLIGLLPTDTPQYYFARRAGGELDSLAGAAGPVLEPTDVSTFSHTYGRLVTAGDGNTQWLVGIPRLRYQASAAAQLRALGWQPERLGWIMTARRGSRADSHSLRAAAASVIQALRSPCPVFPEYVTAVTTEAIPVLPAGYQLIVDRQNALYRGAAAPWQPGSTCQWPQRLVHERPQNSELQVAIQRDVLELLPDSIVEQVSAKIAADFGFTATRKQLTQLIPAGTGIRFSRSGEGSETSLTITGGETALDEATLAVATWVAEEVATHQPVQAAFRLPDGTLGYEYVPSPVEVPPVMKQGCGPLALPTRQLSLCRTSQYVMLTTQSLTLPPAEAEVGSDSIWHVAAGSETTGTIPHLDKVTSATAAVYPDTRTVEFIVGTGE